MSDVLNLSAYILYLVALKLKDVFQKMILSTYVHVFVRVCARAYVWVCGYTRSSSCSINRSYSWFVVGALRYVVLVHRHFLHLTTFPICTSHEYVASVLFSLPVSVTYNRIPLLSSGIRLYTFVHLFICNLIHSHNPNGQPN